MGYIFCFFRFDPQSFCIWFSSWQFQAMRPISSPGKIGCVCQQFPAQSIYFRHKHKSMIADQMFTVEKVAIIRVVAGARHRQQVAAACQEWRASQLQRRGVSLLCPLHGIFEAVGLKRTCLRLPAATRFKTQEKSTMRRMGLRAILPTDFPYRKVCECNAVLPQWRRAASAPRAACHRKTPSRNCIPPLHPIGSLVLIAICRLSHFNCKAHLTVHRIVEALKASF
jgi:hypothetical protein